MMQIKMVITCLFLVGLCGRAAPQELRDVYRRVRDAVVTIHTEERETSVDAWGTTFEGEGSGVLISRDGKVMTAAHVIQAVDALSVEFLDGQIIPARVLASIPAFDIAPSRALRLASWAALRSLDRRLCSFSVASRPSSKEWPSAKGMIWVSMADAAFSAVSYFKTWLAI